MTVKYPQTIYLEQVSGVGPITSLYFVLKIENPQRFKRTRDIGAFVGLCPKRDQSGETDKELRISKCGDRYLRRLLVGAAQYILGPFGPESALRDYGLRLAQDGTAKAKKRAVVAVARKLAVLLLTLWKFRQPYEAFPIMAHRSSDGGYAPPNPAPLVAAGVRGELLSATGGRTIRKDCGRTLRALSPRPRNQDSNLPPLRH